MKIRVRQRVPKYIDRAKDIIEWFVSKHIGEQGERDISINLYLRWINTDGDKVSYCFPAKTKDRYTLIVAALRRGAEYAFIRDAVHELWHLKQMYTGRLRMSNYSTRFDGKRYPAGIKYDDMPWEIEAYGLEIALVDQYLTDRNIRDQILTPAVIKVMG